MFLSNFMVDEKEAKIMKLPVDFFFTSKYHLYEEKKRTHKSSRDQITLSHTLI